MELQEGYYFERLARDVENPYIRLIPLNSVFAEAADKVFKVPLEDLMKCDTFRMIVRRHAQFKLQGDKLIHKTATFVIDLQDLVADGVADLIPTDDPKVYYLNGMLMTLPERQKIETSCSTPMLIKSPVKAQPKMWHISGPISVREYVSQALNLHVILFGDVHVKAGACSEPDTVRIDKFIVDQINLNADKTIDFFFESGYLQNKQAYSPDVRSWKQDNSYMHDLSKTFAKCFNVSKAFCPYRNARFHYVDIRALTELSVFSSRIAWLGQTVDNTQSMRIAYRGGMIVNPTAQMTNDLNWVKTNAPNAMKIAERYAGNLSNVLNVTRITRNLQDIGYSLKSKLEKYFEPKLKDHFQSALKGYVTFTKSGKDLDLLDGMQHILKALTLLQDYYTAARLLRRFERPGREGPDIMHAFIYVGNAHAVNLSGLFDRIMTLEYKQDVAIEKQCVELPYRKNIFSSS